MIASLARYVRDCDVEDYERLGWLTRAYHGQRGENEIFVLVWLCRCPAKEPGSRIGVVPSLAHDKSASEHAGSSG